MNTGENEQALRKIIDFIRQLSIVLLLLHFYVIGYNYFRQWGYTHEIVDSILLSIGKTGLLSSTLKAKSIVFGLLIISLIGAKGKKDEDRKSVV